MPRLQAFLQGQRPITRQPAARQRRELIVKGAGRLTRVAVSGTTATATVLKDGLNSPTSVARYGGYGWVAEGQLGHFLGALSGPPNTPFLVRRVALP